MKDEWEWETVTFDSGFGLTHSNPNVSKQKKCIQSHIEYRIELQMTHTICYSLQSTIFNPPVPIPVSNLL